MDNSLIELHHHPFTLYDLIESLLNNIINQTYNLNTISSFIIQKHIQEQHLLDLVPFVPLTKTYHEQYHKLDNDFLIDESHKIQLKKEWIYNIEKLELLDKFLGDVGRYGI